MARKGKRKGRIKIKQSVRLANVKNNAANIGHAPALNNSANLRVTIRRKA